jgi:hypothetical protein
MKLFVKDPLFQHLNIGFALDEGLASPDSTFVGSSSTSSRPALHSCSVKV